MKIAIPTFATRVSPRFDCSRSVLVAVVDGESSVTCEQFEVSNWASHERINKLLELGVDTVICGGIDRWSATSLQSAGVTIYGWVTGEAQEALDALLRGDLDADTPSMGGGRCACRRLPGSDCGQRGPPAWKENARGAGRRRGRRHTGPAGA